MCCRCTVWRRGGTRGAVRDGRSNAIDSGWCGHGVCGGSDACGSIFASDCTNRGRRGCSDSVLGNDGGHAGPSTRSGVQRSDTGGSSFDSIGVYQPACGRRGSDPHTHRQLRAPRGRPARHVVAGHLDWPRVCSLLQALSLSLIHISEPTRPY